MNALLINSLEACQRQALFSLDWEPKALASTEFLRRGIHEGLTTYREDYGEATGEMMMELAGERGLAVNPSVHINMYSQVIHHAALADLIATRLRQDGRWEHPEPMGDWDSLAFMNGSQGLKRLVLTSRWDEEREAAELHSWLTLAEMAVYELPLTMHVIVLGSHRQGKRHSAWGKGFLHPRNRKLRFKRNAHYGQRDKPFGDNWIPAYREDHSEIEREAWLEAMEQDDMFSELHLQIPVNLPSASKLKQLREIIKSKSRQIEKLEGWPEPSYSACHDPIRPCAFQECCLGVAEYPPSEEKGFVHLD